MDKSVILDIVDLCMIERLESVEPRPRSKDVRDLNVTCQQVLYEAYAEGHGGGIVGEAEDILRNDNVKTALDGLPESVRELARDILRCAHFRILGVQAAQ